MRRVHVGGGRGSYERDWAAGEWRGHACTCAPRRRAAQGEVALARPAGGAGTRAWQRRAARWCSGHTVRVHGLARRGAQRRHGGRCGRLGPARRALCARARVHVGASARCRCRGPGTSGKGGRRAREGRQGAARGRQARRGRKGGMRERREGEKKRKKEKRKWKNRKGKRKRREREREEEEGGIRAGDAALGRPRTAPSMRGRDARVKGNRVMDSVVGVRSFRDREFGRNRENSRKVRVRVLWKTLTQQ